MLKFHPAVFAVGKEYQIIVTTKNKSLVSIKVGDKIYVDDNNGILRSELPTHKISVPQDALNEECMYTVIETKIITRLAYNSKLGNTTEYNYKFRPIPENRIRFYHIADAHSNIQPCIKAADYFGKIDFLILNGDIVNECAKISNTDVIYNLTDILAKGEIPIVFSRGNHDLRGAAAEFYTDYTPTLNGKTYYSFRLGKIWGLCLDCGEDKADDSQEYGGTIACSQFREKETEFIRSIIKHSYMEYNEADVKYKLLICHHPFTHKLQPPFDIEEDTYREWAKLLRDIVMPDVMICGHTHKYGIYTPGEEFDDFGQPCLLIVGSNVDRDVFGGTGFELDDDSLKVTFTESSGAKKKKIFELE